MQSQTSLFSRKRYSKHGFQPTSFPIEFFCSCFYLSANVFLLLPSGRGQVAVGLVEGWNRRSPGSPLGQGFLMLFLGLDGNHPQPRRWKRTWRCVFSCLLFHSGRTFLHSVSQFCKAFHCWHAGLQRIWKAKISGLALDPSFSWGAIHWSSWLGVV